MAFLLTDAIVLFFMQAVADLSQALSTPGLPDKVRAELLMRCGLVAESLELFEDSINHYEQASKLGISQVRLASRTRNACWR